MSRPRGGSKVSDEQILDFIESYLAERSYAPSYREVCDAVGFASPCSIAERLRRLREMGLVDYADRSPRTLRVVGR